MSAGRPRSLCHLAPRSAFLNVVNLALPEWPAVVDRMNGRLQMMRGMMHLEAPTKRELSAIVEYLKQNAQKPIAPALPPKIGAVHGHSSETLQHQFDSFIALEALLGDEEEESIANGRITDRLADRYAFLVGTTAMDRARRRDGFKRLYKVRGRVVHGNQSRAALAHDFASRYEVLEMARAAITEEAKRYLGAYAQQLGRALRALASDTSAGGP
jgi:hypothetical protein